MFRTADIREVIIAVPAQLRQEVVSRLGHEALVHLRPQALDDLPAATSMQTELSRQESELQQKLAEIETLRKSIPPAIDVDRPDAGSTCADECLPDVCKRKNDQFAYLYQKIFARVVHLQELAGLQTELAEAGIDIGRLPDMKLCRFVFGTLPDGRLLSGTGRPGRYVIRQFGCRLIGISLPEYAHDMLSALQRSGYRDESETIGANKSMGLPLSCLQHSIVVLQNRLRRIEKFFAGLQADWAPQLQQLHDRLKLQAEILGASKLFLFSRETIFIRGWVEHAAAGRLTAMLRTLCDSRYVCRIADHPDPDSPVILKNTRLFKPFELILKNAGLPENIEIDPTPLTAVTYSLLFGVMFGDVGQGLVLIVLGIMLRRFGRRRASAGVVYADAGFILQTCGISAVIFGFCYGSLFANEHLIPALLFHPMENILPLFFAVIMMGVAFISLGLTMHIVNAFLRGDYMDALFGQRGAVGLLLYLGAVALTVRYLKAGVTPAVMEVTAVIIAPVALFCLRPFLGFVLFHQSRLFPDGLFTYIAETIVELLEMFSGFLSNTVSFIRAGAFALSHAGLGIAVYTLAGIVSPDGLSPASLTVIILGNIFIILLEGMVCGIQSMRLEFYEFMGKFFGGRGQAFSPFKLTLRLEKH